jgi:transposase
MNAYSPDLRAKILAAVDAGMTKSAAARIFQVGRATIKRYAALRRDHHSLAPKRHPGRPPTIRGAHQETLRLQVLDHPAAYLDEHCRLFAAATTLTVSESTMSRAIRRLGFTRKKGRWAPPSETRTSVACGAGSSGISPLSA